MPKVVGFYSKGRGRKRKVHPMKHLHTIEATKNGDKKTIRVYTCFRDKTFSEVVT